MVALLERAISEYVRHYHGERSDRFCRREGDPSEVAERMSTDLTERLSLLLRWLSPLSISTPLSFAHADGLGARPKRPQRMPDARSEATSWGAHRHENDARPRTDRDAEGRQTEGTHA